MLSILVCSLESRKRQLAQLQSVLKPQLNERVELIVDTDNGEVPIGLKRNRLLRKAQRKYVAFVDDDDLVSDNYVELILQAIARGKEPDCIGIVGQMVDMVGHRGWTFRHSITVSRWCKDKHKHIYFRTPNHLNPIRRELALAAGFPDEKSFGEDHDYANRIQPLLKTEAFIEDVIYFYVQGNKGA